MIKKIKRQALIVLAFIICIGLAAQLSLDVGLIAPFTAQTLVIAVMYFYMPIELRIVSILSYLLLGILGLPLFSEMRSGWTYFYGAAFGFFIGFALSTLVKKPSKTMLVPIAKYFLGVHLIIWLSGILWIAYYTQNIDTTVETALGLLPGLGIKSAIGSVLIWIREQKL